MNEQLSNSQARLLAVAVLGVLVGALLVYLLSGQWKQPRNFHRQVLPELVCPLCGRPLTVGQQRCGCGAILQWEINR